MGVLFVDVLFTLSQSAAVFGGMACLLMSMRAIKKIGGAQPRSVVWEQWFQQSLWVLGFALLMGLSLLFGDGEMKGLGIIASVAALFLGLGSLQIFVTLRKISRHGVVGKPSKGGGKIQYVLVKKLQPNRLRGRTTEGESVVFTEADLAIFEETRGVAKMINFSLASQYSTFKNCVPIMSFRSDDGDDFVLYQDDVVVPV